MKHLLVNITYN